MSISTSISTNRSMPRESALCTAHAQAKASCLQLPQLRLQGPLACFQDACLLVVGGRAPEVAWLRKAAKGREVWAVDHGLDACLAADIRPQRLIGDGDSAAPAAWQLAKEQHIPIEQFPVEKDDTDTQLALKRAREAGFPASIVTGAFGGRFDHAFSTVFSAAQQPGTCLLADDREILLFVRGGEQISIHCLQAPAAISLLPLTERVQGVTLTGTHWPLVDASLIQAKPYAVSNVLAADANTIDVHIRQGILGVHLVFESASDTLHCPSREHGELCSSCRSLSACDADELPRKAQQQMIPQR